MTSKQLITKLLGAPNKSEVYFRLSGGQFVSIESVTCTVVGNKAFFVLSDLPINKPNAKNNNRTKKPSTSKS